MVATARCCCRVLRQTSRSFTSSSRVLQADSAWKPALEPGTLPAYDEALKFLAAHSEKQKTRLQLLKTELSNAQDTEQRSELERQVRRAEVTCEINDPASRWAFQNGRPDYSRAVHRAMYETRWRKEGDLAFLMDRLNFFKVVPDVLPAFDPSVDLLVKHVEASKWLKSGTHFAPEQTVTTPSLEVRVMHADTRLYTLALVDPDVPKPTDRSYTNYCHHLITNLSVAPDSGALDLSQGQQILSYIPPHPQKLTNSHRYVYVLLEQTAPLDIPEIERLGFDLRQFVQQHQLTPAGIHFFTSKWSPAVTDIYKTVLNKEEPVFVRPRKADRFLPKAQLRAGSTPVRSWAFTAQSATQSSAEAQT